MAQRLTCFCTAERPIATHCTQTPPRAPPPLTRRAALLAACTIPTLVVAVPRTDAAAPTQLLSVQAIEEEASRRYAARDFPGTLSLLDELVRRAPDSPRWREMRAQTLVDAKRFSEGLDDYNAALQYVPSSDLLDRARILSGRALAHEGLAAWQAALQDYTVALDMAAQANAQPDPYVLNSRGNVLASLARYAEARQDYLQSAQLFQGAKGFRGANGSTTMRLDGSVFAFSNAAMMAVQLGDEAGALREMQGIARRAPGSVDVRAALAAIYWSQGQTAAAEAEWQFACDNITAGCSKYQDDDWLSRIRRWPPVMVGKMADFLAFRVPENLTKEQLEFWEENGYLVLNDFASPEELTALKQRAEAIVQDFDPSTVSIFSTRKQTDTTDQHFLASANGVSCFFEEKAFDASGNLVQSKEHSINKIGHAMHDIDPVFRPWSRSSTMAHVMRQLGQAQPTPVQSMYIFKQPRIGGEVVPHQDSSFLYTTPLSCIGTWLAIEDANRTNGCLYALPGSHKGPLARRFIRDPVGVVSFDQPAGVYELDKGVALEVGAGTMVVLHGKLVHWSSENTSDVSRHAYSMHIVDGAASYAADNWLQRDAALPFEPLNAAGAA